MAEDAPGDRRSLVSGCKVGHIESDSFRNGPGVRLDRGSCTTGRSATNPPGKPGWCSQLLRVMDELVGPVCDFSGKGAKFKLLVLRRGRASSLGMEKSV